MALCLLVEIVRTVQAPSDAEIWRSFEERFALERVIAEEGPEADESLYEELAWLEERERTMLLRDPAYSLGYRSADGLSLRMFSSAFVHGGWLHLIGNMIFLWLVGCNLEDRWGHGVFAAFYLVAAAVSAWAYGLWHPGSETLLIGASGAVSGAMGAFLVCYHSASIRYWYFYWFYATGPRTGTFEAPAFIAFPLWFLEQAFYSWIESYVHLGVAYSAHVGGFVFGFGAAMLLRTSGVEAKHLLPRTQSSWTEDEDFVRGVELARQGDIETAVAALGVVVERDPDHIDARIELVRVQAAAGKPASADNAAAVIVELRRRGEAEAVVELYQQLAAIGAPALPDRALVDVARCAEVAGEPTLVVRATSALMKQHPDSPLIPRALWDVAQAQKRESRPDLVEKTLRMLVQRYPLDPFTDRARGELEAMWKR